MSTIAQNAKAIFLEAVENHSFEEWSMFLDGVCRDDAELRQLVEELLFSHKEKDNLFDLDPTAVVVSTTKDIGETIGPYKLLQLLGEGGMGIVYLAAESDRLRCR